MNKFSAALCFWFIWLLSSTSVSGQNEVTYGLSQLDACSPEVTALAYPNFTSSNVTIATSVFTFLVPEGTVLDPSIPPIPATGSFVDITGVWTAQLLTEDQFDAQANTIDGLGGRDVYQVVLEGPASPTPTATAGVPIQLFSFALPSDCNGGSIEILTNDSPLQQEILAAYGTNFNNEMTVSVDDGVEEDIYGGNDPSSFELTCPLIQMITANDDMVSTCEGTEINIDVLSNDEDIDCLDGSGGLTVTVTVNFGTVSVNDNGTPADPLDDLLDYTPNAGFSGTDQITYQLCDVNNNCSTAIVTVTVEEQLLAGDDNSDEFCEGTNPAYDLTALLSNDADAGGNWAQASGDVIDITDETSVDFSMAAVGVYTFNYTHPEGVSCPSDQATFTITIQPQPDDALAVSGDDICAGQPATITVFNSEPGVEYQLRLDSDDSNVGGVVTGNGGDITFTVSTTATTTYNILAANSMMGCSVELVSKPTVMAATCSTFAFNDINQTPVNVPVTGDVSTNDFDPQGDNQLVTAAVADTDGDGLVDDILPIGTPATVFGTDDDGNVVPVGTLTLNNDGSYGYTPVMDFTGSVPFGYTVTDDNPAGVSTDDATVTIEVIGESDPNANEPPIANDDTQTTEQDTDVTGNVLDNDSDPDGDPITVISALADTDGDGLADDPLTLGTPVTVFGTDPSGSVVVAGVLTLNTNGVYTFDPEPSYLGKVPSAYTISDPDGLTDDATLTILVEGDADNATYANDDGNTGPQDIAQVGNVLDNDFDPESDLQTLTGALDSNGGMITAGTSATLPSGGTLTLNADGSYLYTPQIGFVGTEIVRYTVEDNGGPAVATDVATLYLTTLPLRCVQIEAWVYLEGASITSSGGSSYSFPMRTDLNDLRLLPGQVLVDPFLGSKYNPGQPYSGAPWFYGGTEGSLFDSGGDANMAAAGYPSTVVDWVLVSLRETPDATGSPLCETAALLHDDGRIELTSNFECCTLDDAQSYYLVVEHRSHLIVMSDAPVPIVGGKLTYDFRFQQSYINDPFGFGSFAGQKEVTPGVYVMYGGNGDQASTGVSDTDINGDDRARFELDNSDLGEYRIGDYNLSGDTNFADRLIFEQNNGTFTSVPRD